jgi:hypothetical protein
MKWLLGLPVTLAGLTGCAVYTPVGHHGAVVVARPATVYVQPGPVVVRPSTVYVRPAHRGRTRRDRDGDGIPNRRDRDRDGDGVPNRYDREPGNPWRR